MEPLRCLSAKPQVFLGKTQPVPTCAFPQVGIFFGMFQPWLPWVSLTESVPLPVSFSCVEIELSCYLPTGPHPVSGSWMGISQCLPTPLLPSTLLRGIRYLLYPHQVKIQDLNQYGRSENQERLTL